MGAARGREDGSVGGAGDRTGALPVTDEQLAALSPAQRRELVRRLGDLEVAAPTLPRGPRLRRLLVVAALGSAALVPWIGVLAVTLPHRYVAAHWTLAWVGFDLALLAGLAVTGWMTWRARPALVFPALVTATLLVCDAWFDTTTAGRSDVRVSLLSALVLELPLAIVLLAAVATVARTVTVSVVPTRAARPRGRRVPTGRPWGGGAGA